MKFDSKFIFGIADADLQVIGEEHTLKNEQSLPTMWTHSAQTSGKVFNNDSPLPGIDRYHYWQEDIELMKKLGTKDYRTSVSMARILTADKKVNKKAISWYKSYFKALKQAGMKIYVTLYHWELPQMLMEKGGWENPETIEWLRLHAQVVYEHLNEYIEEYYIINEHICAIFLGYHLAWHAPFQSNFSGALKAGHNLLLAQGYVFADLKKNDPKLKVSTVYNLMPAYGNTASMKDREARQLAYDYNTTWFLDPIYTGKYPQRMLKLVRNIMPEVKAGDMDIIQIGSGLHALGINYYLGTTVSYDETSDVKHSEVDSQFHVTNGLGWPVYVPPAYPSGLYDLLLQIHSRYELFGLKKIVITENGTACPSEPDAKGLVDDSFRIGYLREHLVMVNKAIRAGVPVEGYFLWTFMDNYEWQEGYAPGSRFGIVHVDRETMKRTPKTSFDWYQKVVKSKEIPGLHKTVNR